MKTKTWFLDIESNDLLQHLLDYSSFPYKLKSSAKLWCVVLRCLETNEVRRAVKEEITKDWLRDNLADATHIGAHNGIKFDFIFLKLFGVFDYTIGYLDESDTLFGRPVEFIDTLILSRLYNPDRYNGHSLNSWGERVGALKTDFRQLCIDKGIIEKDAPEAAQFQQYTDELVTYCEQDTNVNVAMYKELVAESEGYAGWIQATKLEKKLADLAIRRENLGFWFDKKLAVKLVHDLTEKMETISAAIDPILPPKPRNKGELDAVTPPSRQVKLIQAVYLPKRQLKKDGTPTESLKNFFAKNPDICWDEATPERFICEENEYSLPYYEAIIPEKTEPTSQLLKFAEDEKVGGRVEENEDGTYTFYYKDRFYDLPFEEPLETHIKASIDNLDHVKSYLIELGWEPTEWKERDLTKDTKKQNLPYEKRLAVAERWYKETMAGKYKEHRLEPWKGICVEEDILSFLSHRLQDDKPVRVLTSPCVRVGVEKELCSNLVRMGEKVAFAKDFSDYLTYRHRKNSIAGGAIEDMDFDTEVPTSGYLKQYREVDGRIPTPAIEIGTNTNRYKHIGVANIPRITSTYGYEMRSLFGCGEDFYEFGGDFSGLEARISGHYCWKYTDGHELAELFLAPKPNDFHQVTANSLGISRADGKQVNYAVIYGCSAEKLKKMLGISIEKARILHKKYWDSFPALKELNEAIIRSWEKNNKQYVRGIDGRKILVRSPHSALNAVFQSGGVICVKYTDVFIAQKLEQLGYCLDCFVGKPDIGGMIEYHDEFQFAVRKDLITFSETFATKDDAKLFVKNWKGKQLGTPTPKEDGTYYVVLPNIISDTFIEAIEKTTKLMRLNVPLMMDYTVAQTWAGCH